MENVVEVEDVDVESVVEVEELVEVEDAVDVEDVELESSRGGSSPPLSSMQAG